MSAPLGLVAPWIRQVDVNPLAHFTIDRVELILGPKAGFWWLNDDSPYHSRGWAMGFNAGVLVLTPLGLSVGLLVGYESRQTTKACAGSPCIEFRDSELALAFSLAVLY
jgi:hypothetical protein